MYFPDKAGTIREIINFDKKDKITGSNTQEVISRDVSGASASVTYKSNTYDKNGNVLSEYDITINCKDGVFNFDMRDFFDKTMLQAYQGMEVEMKGDIIAYPGGLKAGDKLDDASINIIVKSNGIVFSNITITISDRIVGATESITTSAGTFSCDKISYNIQTKTRMMTINSKAAEWISEGVGMVKTESYDKSGKLMAYSLLTKLK